MLQLLSQSKLLVQIIVIAIAVLVGVWSSPPAQSNGQPKEKAVRVKPESKTWFQVGFYPSNLKQVRNLAY